MTDYKSLHEKWQMGSRVEADAAAETVMENLPELLSTITALEERLERMTRDRDMYKRQVHNQSIKLDALNVADMLWDMDDPERPYDNIDELLDESVYEYEVGHESYVDVQQAMALPDTIYVYKITGDDDDRGLETRRLSPDEVLGVRASRVVARFARKALGATHEG